MRPTPPAAHPASTEDRLLHFRDVNALIGSRCKSSHAARNLARRGQIVAVYLNQRVVRYTQTSVLKLARGETTR